MSNDRSNTTPFLPGDVRNILLDQLNPIGTNNLSTVLTPSMIIDNPLAVYTNLVGKTHQPDRFKNVNEFRAIVLLNIVTSKEDISFVNYVRNLLPARLQGDAASEGLTSTLICMIPELHAGLTNPFRFLTDPREFIRRALRFPAFQLDSVASVEDIIRLKDCPIGSTVNIRFDSSNRTTGYATRLVSEGALNEVVNNAAPYAGSGTAAFQNGDTINRDGSKVAAVAARTQLTETRIIDLINMLTPASILTSDFGPRSAQTGALGKSISDVHPGIDLAAPIGTPIYAPADGTVEFVGDGGNAGRMIRMFNDQSTKTRYMHLDAFAVEKGTMVRKGDIIGYVGNTGNVVSSSGGTGAHLHFEVERNGSKVDPWSWLNGTGEQNHPAGGFRDSGQSPESDTDVISGLTDPSTGLIAPQTFSY